MTRTVVASAGFLPLLFLVDLSFPLWILSAFFSLLVCILSAILARFTSKQRLLKQIKVIFGLLFLFFLAAAYATWRAGIALDQRLPAICRGSTVTALAEIISPINRQYAKNSRSLEVAREKFDITLNSVISTQLPEGCQIEKISGRLRVSRYHNLPASSPNNQRIQLDELHYGDQIVVDLLLREVRGLSAPGAFDIEKFALRYRISAFATVKDVRHAGDALPSRGSKIGHLGTVVNMRARMIEGFESYSDRYRNLGVMFAVMFGDKSKLLATQRDLFAQTGTSHLIAVSGLHIGLCMLLAKFLALLLSRFFPDISQRAVGAFLALFAGLTYLALAGWPVSGQRAYIMLSAWMLCDLFMRASSRYAIFTSAALLILLIDPLSIFDGGFWLSFFAVYILITLGVGVLRSRRKTAQGKTVLARLLDYVFVLLMLQIALSISTPFLLGALGMPYYASSFFANMIAVPIYSIVVIPAILLALLCLSASFLLDQYVLASDWFYELSGQILFFVDVCITVSNSILNFFLISSNSFSIQLSYSFWFAPLILFLLSALLYGLKFPGFKSILALASLVLVFGLNHKTSNIQLEDENLILTQIDVGQGSAYLIQTHGENWLYDTGPSFLFGGDSASLAILPLLRRYGIDALDGLIISHSDDDHAGGMASVLAELKVEKIISSTAQLSGLYSLFAGQEAVDCRLLGDGVSIGSVYKMRTLWPHISRASVMALRSSDGSKPSRSPDEYAADVPISENANNRSCVIQILHNDRTERGLLILAGDIDASVEKAIVASRRMPIETDILTVPHHGSLSSSSHTFLDAIEPDYALISAGYANRYGHPHSEVLYRLSLREIMTSSSAIHGTVQWLYNAEEKRWQGPYCSRAQKSHFWQLNHEAKGCRGGLR